MKETREIANNDEYVNNEVTKALSVLDNISPTISQNNWKVFKDVNLNLIFSYPREIETRTLANHQIGLFANSQTDPQSIMIFYSAFTATSRGDPETFVKTFQNAPSGILSTTKEINIPGFQTVSLRLYKSGKKDTELVLLEQGNQVIAVIVPLNATTNNDSFANALSKIIQSIKTLH